MHNLSDEDLAVIARARRLSAGGVLVVSLLFGAHLGMAHAQTPAPGTIVQGSPDVSIGGVNAARQGDATSQGQVVVTGSPNVFLNGKPVALSGDKTSCNGIVVGSSNGVFVNGKPVARTGDATTACPGQ